MCGSRVTDLEYVIENYKKHESSITTGEVVCVYGLGM